MTKRHFIRAAEIVNAIRQGEWTSDPPSWAGAYNGQIDDYTRAVQTAEAFIILALDFNPRFDTNRFLVACGLVEAPVKAKRKVSK